MDSSSSAQSASSSSPSDPELAQLTSQFNPTLCRKLFIGNLSWHTSDGLYSLCFTVRFGLLCFAVISLFMLEF